MGTFPNNLFANRRVHQCFEGSESEERKAQRGRHHQIMLAIKSHHTFGTVRSDHCHSFPFSCRRHHYHLDIIGRRKSDRCNRARSKSGSSRKGSGTVLSHFSSFKSFGSRRDYKAAHKCFFLGLSFLGEFRPSAFGICINLVTMEASSCSCWRFSQRFIILLLFSFFLLFGTSYYCATALHAFCGKRLHFTMWRESCDLRKCPARNLWRCIWCQSRRFDGVCDDGE